MNGHATNILHNGKAVSIVNTFPVSIDSLNNSLTDAFGRLRTSNVFTLFDSFHRYQDNGKISQFTYGNASSYHDISAGCIVMSIGNTSGDRIYRESNRVFAYQPGKSLLVLQTFCMNPAKTGLRQRQGYFDTQNGIYIQLLNNTVSFVRRSSVSGVVKETIVNQNNWNIDKLDGNGISGINLDISKVQILFIDIEWLGVGSVRIGFVINGKFCFAHCFHHANLPSTNESDTTFPYMTTACLPIRVEFENVTNTSSSSVYKVICASVISEGGYELRGRQRSIGYDITSPKNLQLSNTFYPIISIRLKSTRLGAIVLPTQFNIISTSTSNFNWRLISYATINTGNWLSVNNDSSVEYNFDASNTITDGIVLKSGLFTATANSSPVINLEPQTFKYQLERNTFTNTAYTFTLAVTGSGANDKILATIDFEELT